MHMASAFAFFISLFVELSVCVFLLFLSARMSGKQWEAAQDKARERRMVEHRLNARLLRLNL
jgi:hypothetical protein